MATLFENYKKPEIFGKFGPLNYIQGVNKGRFPYDNSLFIDDDIKAIIDPGSDPDVLRKIQESHVEDYVTVEGIFRKLQIITSCYVAFSHGANDVANAIGPVAGIIPLATTGVMNPSAPIPTWLLALGGIGIAVGCMTWGRRVMRTVGGRITSLTNTRGFSVDFGAATTVLVASKLGMPISTSHTVVGAVIGVGLARGLEAIDLSIIRKIIISWLLTLPIAAGTSVAIFIILRTIVG